MEPPDDRDNQLREDTQKDKYLTFYLGREHYGIEIRYVTEIIKLQPITEVPQVPPYIRGIINLRGKVIPVMDVRVRFQKPAHDYTERTCVIVIQVDEMPIGLIVDGVSEVTSISGENVAPPPKAAMGAKTNRFVQAIGRVDESVRLILDCERLIDEDAAAWITEENRGDEHSEVAQ